ncbi:hypothetical protein ACHAQA_006555 [Verticillium albo-atrum]
MPKTLAPGIYAPTQVFFNTNEDLDTDTIAKHAVRLARAGIAGIVTNGSNGEAVYLTAEERASVTSTTRQALDAAGFSSLPIIVGASDQSVRGTIRLCADAATAGGDAVLLLVPSFFKWAMDGPAIERYYNQVADESPLPVIIYNYPGAVSGIDIDSETLVRLSAHPNIIGTKFTCGNVGKLARVAADTKPVSDITSALTNGEGQPYFAFAGVADFIAPSVTVGGSGAIVGAANVFPRACVRVYDLAVQGRVEEAREAQLALAKADWSLTKRAIPGFKALLERVHGYGGLPRRPMEGLGEEKLEEFVREVEGMIAFEQGLEDKTPAAKV